MFIKDIFEKDIERNIQSVIKVSSLDKKYFDEINEYVVTEEVFKCINLFTSMYKYVFINQDDRIGFWISGFFGSGKSHFLKILYYILKGIRLDLLIQNNKCLLHIEKDLKFLSDIEKDVILFNIDSKNMMQGSVLDIFVNEFNAMRGFSKTYGFICELEERLLEENIFREFKDYFFNLSNKNWEDAREEFYFHRNDLIKSLCHVKNYNYEEGENYFISIEKNYRMNVEKFSEKVSEYISSKGENHSIIFMIDEVSQFISDNLNKMLNLQTIVEELSNKCFGRVFVVVTSHVDINSIDNNKKYDFSKIQSRFESRLYLSSASMGEVLCKRLLLKKEEYLSKIHELYIDRELFIKNNLRLSSLFDSKVSKISREEFGLFYPFFSYQLELIKDIIYFMSINNVISDDMSKGERSILIFFQKVLINFKNYEFNSVVPFYMFYDAISDFIDHNHKYVFSIAYDNRNLDNFDINILKTLLLIKYLPNVIPCVETIETLVILDFSNNNCEKSKVLSSLQKLINEGFVNSDGDRFYFLSKMERDINYKIIETNIESHEIKEFLCDKIFNEVCGISKIRYRNKINFSFNKILNDLNYKVSQKNMIGIKILTTVYDEDFNLDSIRIASGIENNVIIYFNDDKSLIDEVFLYLKLQKFLKYIKSDFRERYGVILLSKEDELKNRLNRINILIINCIKTSSIFVNGEIVSKSFEDVNDIFKDSINRLMLCRFNKFGYINKFIEKFNRVIEIFENQNQLNEVLSLNSLFVNELADFLNQFNKISFGQVFEHFKSIPYGFGKNDVLFGILYLLKMRRIVCNFNFDEIVEGISSDKNFSNKIQISKCDDSEIVGIASCKKMFEQIFDKKYLTNSFYDFFKQCKSDLEEFKLRLDKVKELVFRDHLYPGKDTVEDLDKFVVNALSCSSDEFIERVTHDFSVVKIFDEFDMIFNFYNSVQFEIFEKGLEAYRIFEKDKSFICNSELVKTFFGIEGILNMDKPYGEISKLKVYTQQFIDLHKKILCDAIVNINDFIQDEILISLGLDLVCELKCKLDKCKTLFDVYGIKMESIFLKEKLKG